MAAETMRAIVRDAQGVALRRIAAPVAGPGEVVVRVAVAGVCRTDLRVAAGELGRVPIVLGHELAGWLDGEPVTVVPFSPCGDCAGCAAAARCHAPRWLGVDLDGAFADQVRVPAASVRPLPRDLPMRLGAYVEPVAAAMGALRADLDREARVVIAGDNRIAELTARVLAAHGVASLVRHDPAREPAPAAGSADVVIDSTGGAALGGLIAALRPGGLLILKSRGPAASAIDPAVLVARELTVRGLGHGSFDAAIEWLHDGRLRVDDLLAPPRPLEEVDAVLAAARASEARKLLFAIDPAEAR